MSSANFWLILGLTLVLGWILGLMSRSGGKKWKRELKAEREAHAVALKDRDSRIAALERDRPPVRDHAEVRHRDGAVDNLDLTRRGGDGYVNERDRIRP